MKYLSKLILILAAGVLLANCSGTYKVKKDLNKTGVIKQTPKWYVKYDRETILKYQESGTAVSPDMELAVKKAIIACFSKSAALISLHTSTPSISGIIISNKIRSGWCFIAS